MLSYQHIYHAGNHADILKHYVLTFVINSLNKKEKPYTFFDSHSGSGLYNLLDEKCLKTNESKNGILFLQEKLINHLNINNVSESFALYFDFVSSLLKMNLYPGSPLIENHFLRQQDFLVLSELHPKEIENLRNSFKNSIISNKNNNVQIHQRNGWEMITALTPPKTKRGAILIDPSYETLEDYQMAENTICKIIKRWQNAIILLWYPLLAYKEDLIENMIINIENKCKKINQNIEFCDIRLKLFNKTSHQETSLKNLNKNNPPRLYGSGMFVINAPWKLKEESEKVVDFLEKILKMESNSSF